METEISYAATLLFCMPKRVYQAQESCVTEFWQARFYRGGGLIGL